MNAAHRGRVVAARLARVALVAAGAAGPLHAADAPRLPAADERAAFKAAGFKRQGGHWVNCAEGQITELRDVNGDGQPEALITERGTECHGMTGEGFTLVSRQPDGRWVRLAGGTGIPNFLAHRGPGGWPDLEVGGPGFCFPVLRFDGRRYRLHHHENQGKRCRKD